MALGAYPDLLAINTELGLTLQGLNECITASGEPFTNQLDFAYYSASIAVTYDYNGTITAEADTEYYQNMWQRADISPISRDGCIISVGVSYSIAAPAGSVALNNAGLYYSLSANPDETTHSWTLIESVNDNSASGTAQINVDDGEYLYISVRAAVEILSTNAYCNTTLVDGLVTVPCEGTSLVSGSPTTFNVTVGTG